MMHSSTIPGSMPARRTASRTTQAPSWVAVNDFSAPRNFPVGVRTADTITVSRTTDLDRLDGAGAEKRLQPLENHRRRAHDLARPLRARGLDDQDAVFELDGGDALERRADRRAPREVDLAVAERRRPEDFRDRAGHRVLKRSHAFDLIIRLCV